MSRFFHLSVHLHCTIGLCATKPFPMVATHTPLVDAVHHARLGMLPSMRFDGLLQPGGDISADYVRSPSIVEMVC